MLVFSFLSTETQKCVIKSGSASMDFFSGYYTTSFPNTISTFSYVYYSTQALNAHIADYPFVYNTNNANLEYYLELETLTKDYMVTRIDGYLADPL